MIAIRYIVRDAETAAEFYRSYLEFDQDTTSPGFAKLTRGDLTLVLSEPGAGGGGNAGGTPEPGGWNRFLLQTDDLDGVVKRLHQFGAQFRGDVTEGKGGRQVVVEDPSGNPIELFEPFA
ncbi:VOC family protein [Psychromarinibacter sp. C21-152]|uniref:VOC family protein n=1 Tax=Psychromarinibacter sediminicola TaxID=3033385 RepID=A0AAE3T859_9RHOB|nr:VOC family protein [Psychromarinibacter sediminicola]MDF0601055.1 VOC family protein [Psychromarinibacter sediminicola]